MPATKGKSQKAEKSEKGRHLKDGSSSRAAEAGKGTNSCADEEVSDHCVDCGKTVLKSQRGLTCDACGFWLHADCEGVTDDVYEFLCDHSEDHAIAWYCKRCAVINRKLRESCMAVHDQQQQVEERVNLLELSMNKRLDEMVRAVSGQLEEMRSTLNKRLDKQDTKENVDAVAVKVDKIMATMEKQRTDNHELRDCVQDAVAQKIREDKEEAEDIKRRSTSIILHGLRESMEEEGDARKKHDEDLLANLLHEMNCDEVSIQTIVRLGKQDTSPQAKPRPTKIVMASEQQKDKVLKQAKNLRGAKEKEFQKVFLHQDLTIRQRQRRQELVKEMKQRQTAGEVGLMIIGGRIVTRRPQQAQESVE